MRLILLINFFKKHPFTLLFFLIGIIYIYFSFHVNSNLLIGTKFDYYNYLLDAFFQKRLNLESPVVYDLSFYNDRWYLYWGPSPIFFILPFFLLFGAAANDVIYTLIAGLLNILIFYFLLLESVKYFRIKVGFSALVIVILGFAFVSPNFYLSLAGRIWHTSAIISALYNLLFLLFYFKYLNNPKRKIYLIGSVIFFNFMLLSRYTLIFNGIFFIPLLVWSLYDKRKKFYQSLLIFISITFFFLIILFSYNYERFGNPLETGVKYQKGDNAYNEDLANGKMLSFKNLPHNFNIYFLNNISFKLPEKSEDTVSIGIDLDGNSFFSVYPLLIFIFLVFQKKFFKNRRLFIFLISSSSVITLNTLILLMFMATGKTQFGLRYFFDVIPLLYLLLLPAVTSVPGFFGTAVLLYGIIVNWLGALAFYT